MAPRRRWPRWIGVALLLVGGAACGEHDGDEGTATALTSAVRVEATGCRSRPSIGAGSFIGDELVLTVAHVVAGSEEVRVVLADGTTSRATVVAIDRSKDLAVLAVEAEAPAPGDAAAQGPSAPSCDRVAPAASPTPKQP
jgi:S1-C subfamily serine protease